MKRFIVTQKDLEEVVERGLDTNIKNHIEDSYNGWTNRETWAAFTWITNDESLYNTHRGSDAADLEKDIKRLLDSNWTGAASMEADIGSLWRVNWQEIANALTEDNA